jgi:cytochrome c
MMSGARATLRCFAAAGGLFLASCANESDAPAAVARIDIEHGAMALQRYGCGACHRIPGIASADGVVGPPLVDMARRVYIAGGLPNTPDNMTRWIRAPQEIAPRSAMPDMQVSAADAAAIVTYLYRAR